MWLEDQTAGQLKWEDWTYLFIYLTLYTELSRMDMELQNDQLVNLYLFLFCHHFKGEINIIFSSYMTS